MSSVLMNQQYILNKASLNKLTHKKSKVMYWLVDENNILQEPNPIFPLGTVIQNSLISNFIKHNYQ